MTREEWAKRPLAERIKGILMAWDTVKDMEKDAATVSISPYFYALDYPDLPDTPPPADLTPYLAAAATLYGQAPGEQTVEAAAGIVIGIARSLRDASKEA